MTSEKTFGFDMTRVRMDYADKTSGIEGMNKRFPNWSFARRKEIGVNFDSLSLDDLALCVNTHMNDIGRHLIRITYEGADITDAVFGELDNSDDFIHSLVKISYYDPSDDCVYSRLMNQVGGQSPSAKELADVVSKYCRDNSLAVVGVQYLGRKSTDITDELRREGLSMGRIVAHRGHLNRDDADKLLSIVNTHILPMRDEGFTSRLYPFKVRVDGNLDTQFVDKNFTKKFNHGGFVDKIFKKDTILVGRMDLENWSNGDLVLSLNLEPVGNGLYQECGKMKIMNDRVVSFSTATSEVQLPQSEQIFVAILDKMFNDPTVHSGQRIEVEIAPRESNGPSEFFIADEALPVVVDSRIQALREKLELVDETKYGVGEKSRLGLHIDHLSELSAMSHQMSDDQKMRFEETLAGIDGRLSELTSQKVDVAQELEVGLRMLEMEYAPKK